ncbi:mitochondrial chaperone [Verticillium dahliae]
MTDDKLAFLLTKLPKRSILLLEDADAAFVNRRQRDTDGYNGATVTFSGLLNALDGLAAGEERIAFLTTNHIDRLDPALIRPGRVDMMMRIGEASRHQASQMWDRFYGDIDVDGSARERFLARLDELGLFGNGQDDETRHRHTSTAAIQGLFLFNKNDMEGAIEMAQGLIPRKFEPAVRCAFSHELHLAPRSYLLHFQVVSSVGKCGLGTSFLASYIMSRQTNISDFFSAASQRPRPQPNDQQNNMNSSHPASTWRGARGGFPRGQNRARGHGRGGHGRDRRAHNPDSTRRNRDLAEVAKETRTVLPDILPHLPHAHPDGGRVAVLNLASDYRAGGGWLKGARAQEEALCYRSSLYLSLHKRYYPFDHALMGIYSPDVVIIREDMASGHDLLIPDDGLGTLPVVSVLSIAALRNPTTRKVRLQTIAGAEERIEFADPRDRDVTKGKMRLCLRMAAAKSHGLLVLGALGCGAFHNPPGEVARCWREVLGENEFAGGWWTDVVFAVLDTRSEGNYEVFDDVVGGMMV